MMTIKEFSQLCRCTAQTLRYYDKIDLLKPRRVDSWTGYRYYEAAQAIDCIKIKNLQAADFSIEEIKVLLTKNDRQLYEAFELKISEHEHKLERIREIQRSYLKEKTGMEKIIKSLSAFLFSQLESYEGLSEFGLEPKDGSAIVELVRSYLEKWMTDTAPDEKEVCLVVNDEVYRGTDAVSEKISTFTQENLADKILLGDDSVAEEKDFDPDDYISVWEAHDWEHVRDFLNDVPNLEDGVDYCFCFHLNKDSYRDDISFPIFMLGAMLLKNKDSKVTMSCSVDKSADSQNHFSLLKMR
ncbi:MAG: MerR family transcriptional regulator [Oscillospiraceae bacterium]|nr:MerR family transcriptional regulator [Oscillospiraceae bacterium]